VEKLGSGGWVPLKVAVQFRESPPSTGLFAQLLCSDFRFHQHGMPVQHDLRQEFAAHQANKTVRFSIKTCGVDSTRKRNSPSGEG
jgi:hypothetical protein